MNLRSLTHKITLLSLSTFLFIFVMIANTYAYFQMSEEHGITITTGEFEVEMLIYFGQQVVTYNSNYYDKDKGIVTVNAYDATATNYIGNMNIYISITPQVAARYRFKIQQEWELQRYYLNQVEGNEIPPVFESVYFDRTSAPYYPFSYLRFADEYDYLLDDIGRVYYNGIVSKSDEAVIYHVIEGGAAYPVRSNDVIEEECYLYIDISFDIVQANRFAEVWGIDNNFFNS